MAQKPLNLLFIMTDHQRYDSIGMTQSGVEVTPNLNRLAAEGVVFTRAYTTCPLCAPARTALATGKYPTVNGLITNDWEGVTAGEHKPIHEFLAEAGYEIAHIGVHHVRVRPPLERRVKFALWLTMKDHNRYLATLGVPGNITEGHEAQEDLSAFRRPLMENIDGRREQRMYSNTRTAVWPHAAEHFLDSWLCRQASEFLETPRRRPFALFLCLWAPHPPLRVPQPYASMFDPKRLVLPANTGITPKDEPPRRKDGVAAQMGRGLDAGIWPGVWAAHLGLVRLADDGIGRVLDALRASPAAGNTLTVFTVDHGDHLGQRGMYQKMELYEPAIRIPLIIRAPGAAARRVDTPVSHLDVAPTVLAGAGLPAPADFDGESLLETVTEGKPAREKPVFSQYSGGEPVRGDTRRGIITRRYKYVYDPDDAPELFDLQEDSLEMNNLAGAAPLAATQAMLHRKLAEWAKKHKDLVRFEPSSKPRKAKR